MRDKTACEFRTGSVLPVIGSGLFIERSGRVLLDVPGITFDRHGITVIVGPNGAGKSLRRRFIFAHGPEIS